jgi:glutathione S-transferase
MHPAHAHGEGAAPIEARIEPEFANDLGYIDRCPGDRDYLLDSKLSGADIQMSFVGELAGRWTDRSRYPTLETRVRRFQARPAYLAAVARGGAYALAK